MLRKAPVTILVLISALATLALSLPNDRPGIHPYPGTGMFLLLSDIHFDPFADPAIVQQLGAKPTAACQAPASPAVAHYGADTNYPLLKSALDHVAATARDNHFQYDYVIVTGDFLAHHFGERYRQCVGGGEDAAQKFASDTVSFVDGMIAKALPGVPVFAALGNNDYDKGDYIESSIGFRQSVGRDWSRGWGKIPALERTAALASFESAGYYALPNPAVPNHEFVILNSSPWAARHANACSDTDPGPGGQLQWLGGVLERVKRAGGTATLIMHIPPGIDSMRSTLGSPQPLWTAGCTQKLVAELSDYRGVARELFAGHIHRDDFRILSDQAGKPLLPIHIVPAVSPVYLDNPALEIGWYDKKNGELRDYAAQYLDLHKSQPAWATEYVFTRAYGRPRPDLAGLEDLGRALRAGNPQSGLGKQFANFYGVGVSIFINAENWRTYSCAQTEITLSGFAQCKSTGAHPKP